MRGVFPGSFDPLTIAHLAVADAVVQRLALTRLDLVISVDPLGKDAATQQSLDDRVATIEAFSAHRPWLSAGVTSHRLLADIADGYDVLVVGADKYAQLHDDAFYDSPAHRRDALARLPLLAVIPRGAGLADPGPGAVLVDIPERFAGVSSTAVRAGRTEWQAS